MFPGIVHRRARTESLRSSDTTDAVLLGGEAKKSTLRDDDDHNVERGDIESD